MRDLPITLTLALAATLSCALAAAGCGRAPPGTLFEFPLDAPELVAAGTDPVSGVWESAPWEDGSWLPYPGQVQIRVAHTLGRVPSVVMVYLGFREVPLMRMPPSDYRATPPALAAGDLARVIEVTDTTITVWNDTNGDYFARVVAY